MNTGHPLPEGMDGVLMIEKVVRESDDAIEIETPVFPMQHVRRIGEDIVATELLLPQNRLLSLRRGRAFERGHLGGAGTRPAAHGLHPHRRRGARLHSAAKPQAGTGHREQFPGFRHLAAAQGCLFLGSTPFRTTRRP